MKKAKTLVVTFLVLASVGLAIADEVEQVPTDTSVAQPYDQNGNLVQQ